MQCNERWNILCSTSHPLCCIKIVLRVQLPKIYTKCYNRLIMATVPQQLTVEQKTQVSIPLTRVSNAIMRGILLHLFCELSEVRKMRICGIRRVANGKHALLNAYSTQSVVRKVETSTNDQTNRQSRFTIIRCLLQTMGIAKHIRTSLH